MEYLVKRIWEKLKNYIHMDVTISSNKNEYEKKFSQEKFLYSQ